MGYLVLPRSLSSSWSFVGLGINGAVAALTLGDLKVTERPFLARDLVLTLSVGLPALLSESFVRSSLEVDSRAMGSGLTFLKSGAANNPSSESSSDSCRGMVGDLAKLTSFPVKSKSGP
jgi:hypothetical protein